jgi:UDPglucose 6-dehydrogenase
MKNTIGIIGNGFVGSAVVSGFTNYANIYVYDSLKEKSINTIEELLTNSDFVFVCVPTPMDIETGIFDSSILEQAFEQINAFENKKENQIYIIKSTTIPGVVEGLVEKYPNLKIVFSPEFLTERSANLDFINAARIIFGGKPEDVERVTQFFMVRFPYTKYIKTDITTSQFIKYMANCFFAVKVSFMNEMKQISDKLDVNWNDCMHGFITDGRIGNSHLDVPGHDGNHGFGGKCFPKDINAFINLMKKHNINPTILSAAWEKNLEVREVHDWLNIKGAVSNKK